MSAVQQLLYTPQEYLELERKAAYKSEFINGYIYAMAGASRSHNLVATNVSRELSNQFRGRPCEAYSSDMRVQVSATGMYTYPDVVAVCGDPQFLDEHEDALTNPQAIVEVLSPSTESYDRGEKFAHYRRLTSLSDYLLIAQDKVRVEHYVRQGSGWLLTEYDHLEDVLQLESIGCRLKLADIYDKVPLSEEMPGRNGSTRQ